MPSSRPLSLPPLLSSVALALSLLVSPVLCSYSSSTTPTQCPPGRYLSPTPRCLRCPAGHYSWGGNFRHCLPCPSGTFTPFRGVVDKSLCLPCPHSYTSLSASSHCVSRSNTSLKVEKPSASITCNTDGAMTFIKPPMGVSYLADSVCVSPVTGCPRGSTLWKWRRRALCITRRRGAWTVLCGKDKVFDGVDRCLSCPTGNYVKRLWGTRRKWTCSLCPPGSVSSGGRSKRCVKCRCGFNKSPDGTTCVRTVPRGVTVKCTT